MEMFHEDFKSIAEAIGLTAQDSCRIIDCEKTDKLGISLQGYIHTYYALDGIGAQWTVFFDPARALYSGAHRSSVT
jgi:hypothetical protein